LDGLLGGILGGIIGNITNGVNQGLQDFEGRIIEGLKTALGVKDTYNLFLQNVCEGNFTNPTDPKTQITITKCSDYNNVKEGEESLDSNCPAFPILI